MKFGVVIFPGSNCDYDTYWVLKEALAQDTRFLWHKDHHLPPIDCLILPGGFSYGDYLRSGAIARFSPLMQEVREFAERGGLILGICNGFQILLELGLLPGVMLRNKNLKFLCQFVHLRINNNQTPFSHKGKKGQVLRIPIAHYEGNYYAPPETLAEIKRNNQIVFQYSTPEGELTPEA
ncbi:MAG TPA: phosphoribosylformylglycinamidine synthase subunit PurQ, partial [Candidatus Aminicenantes bacterium]|nr:phosphoribosylformylglycinamidine synthase subunit PurQ [Candidatus Aminicenantes bacterium]